MQTLISPAFLRTITMGELHGELEGCITPAANCSFKYFSSSPSNVCGDLLIGCRTGAASAVSILCFKRELSVGAFANAS